MHQETSATQTLARLKGSREGAGYLHAMPLSKAIFGRSARAVAALLACLAAWPASAHLGVPARPPTLHEEPSGAARALQGAPRTLLSVARSLRTGVPAEASRRGEIPNEEYPKFSGVGAIVCTVAGQWRVSTAFLVGDFDIAVTVAHTFEPDAAPEDCVYNTTDSLGQVRERIPLAYIKSRFDGEPAHDVAVVRLARPSRVAQRTMPFGRFSGSAASVSIIGFRADMDVDTTKRRARGRIYERRGASQAPDGFTHDLDSREIAPGAPVVDERSGVTIGIHTRAFPDGRRTPAAGRNVMVTMSDWLERTLRAEMQIKAEAAAAAGAAP